MLGTLVAESDVPFPAICCVVIFTTCAWVLARLDLFLSRKILAFSGFMLVLPPAMVTFSLSMERGFTEQEQVAKLLARLERSGIECEMEEILYIDIGNEI